MIRMIAVVAALLALGCGNSSPGGGGGSGGTGGGGTGGTGGGGSTPIPDMSQPPADLANAFSCGNSVCMGGEKCCVVGTTPTCMAGSCNSDLGFEAQCNGPSNCGGNPCCITIGAGFTVQSVVCSTSASSCPPMVNATTQSGMDRACHVDADCIAGLPATPAPQLPDCCTNTASGQKVCFNKAALNLPGVMGFTCP
jgi:hypothetical protein